MKHIFYEDFDNLLSDYRNPVTREDKLIKHKLDSIVALYDNCTVEEREFADEITLEFSRIIALLKKQHKQEIFELTQKETPVNNVQESPFEYDREVLEAFYDYFKGNYELAYWEIENHKFESNEERRQKVNLTMWDYCNRIKTFSNKYLFEIYSAESIPHIIHGDNAEEFESFEPIVFVYNNLELIIAKIKTTDENGKVVKQRLNIRSALRKLNEFKQGMENAV
jgi:hypothetical protein